MISNFTNGGRKTILLPKSVDEIEDFLRFAGHQSTFQVRENTMMPKMSGRAIDSQLNK